MINGAALPEPLTSLWPHVIFPSTFTGPISSEQPWNPLFGLSSCESLEKASADLSAGPRRHAGLRFWNRFFSTPFHASRGHVLHIFSLQTQEHGALTHT